MEFHAALPKPGFDLPLEYRIRQLLPNFEFLHRRA
jgi:hypothetical protein